MHVIVVEYPQRIVMVWTNEGDDPGMEWCEARACEKWLDEVWASIIDRADPRPILYIDTDGNVKTL